MKQLKILAEKMNLKILTTPSTIATVRQLIIELSYFVSYYYCGTCEKS